MSIFDKLKNDAISAVGKAAQSLGSQRETFTFRALPESLAEMQALPEAALGTPYAHAALYRAFLYRPLFRPERGVQEALCGQRRSRQCPGDRSA